MIKSEEILQLVKEGFFDEWKTTTEIVKKLDTMGFTLKGKQVARLGQLLNQLCRKGILERNRLPQSEWKITGGKFSYRKRKEVNK